MPYLQNYAVLAKQCRTCKAMPYLQNNVVLAKQCRTCKLSRSFFLQHHTHDVDVAQFFVQRFHLLNVSRRDSDGN